MKINEAIKSLKPAPVDLFNGEWHTLETVNSADVFIQYFESSINLVVGACPDNHTACNFEKDDLSELIEFLTLIHGRIT